MLLLYFELIELYVQNNNIYFYIFIYLHRTKSRKYAQPQSAKIIMCELHCLFVVYLLFSNINTFILKKGEKG